MLTIRSEDPRRTRAVRVVIGSGEPLFGEAMGRAVRDCARLQLAGEATEGRAALDLVRTLAPEVAVLGPGLGDLDGDRILDLIALEKVPTRLVFVGDRLDQALAYERLGRGAACLLTTVTGAEELCDAILIAAAGDVFLAREVHPVLASEIRLRTSDDRPVLSEREREVLRRLAAGERAPEMARAMYIAESTVKTHLHHLYEKLGVSSRTAAVAVAMRRGLID